MLFRCFSRLLLHSFFPDWITAIVFGLPANLIQHLQSVQNAAARLIFRIRRSEHITPALISLHCLRVPERIYFKLAVMMYRSIHGTSPSYLQSCFTRVSDMTSRRRLGSTLHRLDVPPVRLYSQQAGVSGFWCHRLERSASPRRICVVTRGFQTTQDLSVFPFSTKTQSYDWCVTITIHHYCLDTCGPCNN